MKYIAIYFIKLYKRFLANKLDTRCRFYPTCSIYSMIAISDFGIFKGGALSGWRILRCNPLGKHGEDKPPVSKHKYREFI